jgi:hypothetical protein
MLYLVPPVAAQGSVPTRGSKVKNVSEHTDNNCKELYVPRRNVAIDERTVGFKGRIQVIQSEAYKVGPMNFLPV